MKRSAALLPMAVLAVLVLLSVQPSWANPFSEDAKVKVEEGRAETQSDLAAPAVEPGPADANAVVKPMVPTAPTDETAGGSEKTELCRAVPNGKTMEEVWGNRYFLDDLQKMGMPSLLGTTQEAYYSAIDAAVDGFPGKFLKKSPFVYYGKTRLSNYNSWTYNLFYRQQKLLAAHRLYQQMVAKNRTKKIMYVFGSSIESAAKKVNAERARLKRAWEYYRPVYMDAKVKATYAKSELDFMEPTFQSAKEKLASLGDDRRNPENASLVNQCLKIIKDLEPKIQERQAQVKGFSAVENLFHL